MSEKNFTNATGNWIVSNTGEISYVGTVKVTGELTAAKPDAGENAFAAGSRAGQTGQGNYAVAVGRLAGETTQGGYSVAVGVNAGNSTQGSSAVAVGNSAGYTGQGNYGVAVGVNAGQKTQGSSAIAVGYWAGNTSQGNYGVAVGNSAGIDTQGQYAVSVGRNAGHTTQGENAVAVGNAAGYTTQSTKATALGFAAGQTTQGAHAVAVGSSAGSVSQSEGGVAIGTNAGKTSQGLRGISIGESAGESNQGQYSIAIGRNAGIRNQGGSGIIISSGGYEVNRTNIGHIVLNSPAGSLNFNGVDKWTFAGGAVQATDYLDANGNSIIGSGGGAVNSVNGKTGAVNLNYSDVGAQVAGNYLTSSSLNGYATQTWVGQNYQAKGSYATASHNHNGVYQPAGSYAASNHNHSGVYAPASHTHSQYASTSYAYSKAESDNRYEVKGGGGGADPLNLNNGISLAKGNARGSNYQTKSVFEMMTTAGSLPNHTGFELSAEMNGGWGSQAVKFCIGSTWGAYNSSPALTIKEEGCYATDFIASSDEKLKKNIVTVKSDLIQQLEGREWDWKRDDKKASGVIAQEVEKIIPHLVEEDSEGIKRVSYNGLTAYLIEAVKELSARVKELEEAK
jgi:hypothetical protein